MGLETESVHALVGVDLVVGLALADGLLRDAEPDRDLGGDAVGETEEHAIGENRAGIPAGLTAEAPHPAADKSTSAEGSAGQYDGSPSGSVTVDVKSPSSSGWLAAARACRGPRAVNVGQLGERNRVKFDKSHTPIGPKAWGSGRQTMVPRRVVSSSGVYPPAEPSTRSQRSRSDPVYDHVGRDFGTAPPPQ